VSSLVGYQFAHDERDVVEIAERLGETRSPLTVDELLELLKDPRFNVRFETVISIARTRPDPRLTEALLQILNGTELALSTISAWALGRIGDHQAREALYQGLDSPYHSIRAHSARALGALEDAEAVPILLQRLNQEADKGLQMAYASALGKLQAREATGNLLTLLNTFENEGARLELALSLARLAGNEGHFIRLVREARADPGTVTARAVDALRKKLRKEHVNGTLEPALEVCIDTLARGELEKGAQALSELICQLPPERFNPTCLAILQDCAEKLKSVEASRLEYTLLALHTIDVGWQS
jgi:HEAT repeat protein